MKRSVYHVPVVNLESLATKIDKVNKRARKNGLVPVRWGESGRYVKMVPDGNRVDPVTRKPLMRPLDMAHVWVEARTVKVAGWTFVATLAHAGEAGNVVRSVPGAGEMPVEYRDAAPNCDHCGYKRRRNDTYVLRHDDGSYKQVGSTCIADFLGMDATRAAAFAEYLLSLRTASEEGEYLGGGGGNWGIDSATYLALTVRNIREHGWTSKGAARESSYLVATAERAGNDYWDWYDRKRDKYGSLRVADPTEAELAEADEVLDWARSLEGPLSDYLHNVKVVASASTVEHRGTGILASAVVAYRRAVEREIERRAAKEKRATSEWLGEVGERITLTGKVTMVKELAGNYGATFLTKIDASANGVEGTAVWFASRELDRGETYTITATIKDTREWNGEKETVVTRGRVA